MYSYDGLRRGPLQLCTHQAGALSSPGFEYSAQGDPSSPGADLSFYGKTPRLRGNLRERRSSWFCARLSDHVLEAPNATDIIYDQCISIQGRKTSGEVLRKLFTTIRSTDILPIPWNVLDRCIEENVAAKIPFRYDRPRQLRLIKPFVISPHSFLPFEFGFHVNGEWQESPSEQSDRSMVIYASARNCARKNFASRGEFFTSSGIVNWRFLGRVFGNVGDVWNFWKFKSFAE